MTFQKGKTEPIHSWYPLAEGFSSAFVHKVLNHYTPSAQRVLDPFSGTGTTAIEVMRMGKEALYCEVNPFFRFLVSTKSQVFGLDKNEQQDLLRRLREITRNFSKLLQSAEPDEPLRNAYSQLFPKSKFFEDDALATVLKARSLVDTIHESDPFASDLLSVAFASNLVHSSLYLRAGDLRRRRPREIERIQPLSKLAKTTFDQIIRDIDRLTPQTLTSPTLVCEDARTLVDKENLNLDAMITSPPYVNGTNYVRNSKLELWFTRSISSSQDIKDLRTKSVTAGINSVQLTNIEKGISHPVLDSVVAELEKKAYDRRIPKLVQGYFNDIYSTFSGVAANLNENGIIAIDIGDSNYAGVHVPVFAILNDLLNDMGLVKIKELVLRSRRSRDQSYLNQVLLLYRKEKDGPTGGSDNHSSWPSRWSSFKKDMPHQQHPFSKRNWGHSLHSLCSYQGKMKPSLAYSLVKVFVNKGGRILDPFAGVGTIPFEAALNGIKSFGFDISPAAFYIASAKVSKPDGGECFEIIRTLGNYIQNTKLSNEDLDRASQFGFNRTLKEYYHPDTLQEIVLTRNYFLDNKPKTSSEFLVVSSLLHILHGNRPYALSRRSHPITPFAPTGPIEPRRLIPRLEEKVRRSLNVRYPQNYVEGRIFDHDATLPWPKEVRDLDAIITSPPFFDSTRFAMGNWLRLWFCGWEKDDFKSKPEEFIDEKQKVSFDIYKPILKHARKRLKDDGIVVFHLGKSKKCDMAEELSKITSPLFEVADLFDESVAHCESHGVSDKGTVKSHQYLVLK